MAIPVLYGVKSDSEKFAGAVRTYCIEAHDAGREVPPGRHVPQPGPELRQGLRRDLPDPHQDAWTTSGPPPGECPPA